MRGSSENVTDFMERALECGKTLGGMLGRKQSIRVDVMGTDYVQDESLNENTEIDWVNKVNSNVFFFFFKRVV